MGTAWYCELALILLSYVVCESTERRLQPCWAQLLWGPTNREMDELVQDDQEGPKHVYVTCGNQRSAISSVVLTAESVSFLKLISKNSKLNLVK
jgi:hypothetical protein